MNEWELREMEAMQAAGYSWREAHGIVSEYLAPRYTIWWRFELGDMRRWET
jgi:hypothetical protein